MGALFITLIVIYTNFVKWQAKIDADQIECQKAIMSLQATAVDAQKSIAINQNSIVQMLLRIDSLESISGIHSRQQRETKN